MTTQSIDSLGPLTKSWSPGSLSKDPWAGKNLPFWFMPVQVVVVFASLFLCLSGAVVIYVQILKPMNLYPGILWGGLVFAVLFVPPMFLLHWIGQQLVNRNELAIHRNGVRWAKNAVLFDQIQSLSMGTQTFNETHFPTLNVLWKAHWRHGEAMQKAEEKERAATLAFHLKDGTVKQWRNLGQCFPPQTLEEFFAKLVDGFGV